jgi:hypothetical protein
MSHTSIFALKYVNHQLEAFAIKFISYWLIHEKTNHLGLKNHSTIFRVLVNFLAYFG